MTERPSLFPASEFRRRAAALQTGLDTAGIDALLLTSPADIFYLTGFLTRFWESPARPWFVVLPRHGAPVAVIPAIGADLMGRTWVDDIRTWPAPLPRDDGISLLTEALAQAVPPAGRVGLPMGPETHLRMPLTDYEDLRRRLEPRRFVDATHVVQRVREVKSEPEIARIRATCRIAGAAFARVPELARAGVPLGALFRAFQSALLDAGADWVAYLAGGAGPDGYGDVISPADDRPLQAGDILMLDTGAVRDGYFCDFDRNYSVGPASAAAGRAHAALRGATEAVLAEIRPGITAADAHRMLSAALIERGATPGTGRLGHGLGVTLTEWPSLSPHDRTPLRAGMVLTLEPSAYVAPGRLLVHEENIVLRASGAELLSPRAPERLPEVPA